MSKLLIVIGIVGSIFIGCEGVKGSDPTIEPYPTEYSVLYEELSENLTLRENALRADWDGVHKPLIYAATLLTASCNNGEKLLDPNFRAGNSLILNKLYNLGIIGIVLQINYPILTSNFTADAPAYLTAYKEIAAEIRAYGMKIIVEHNILLPGYSTLDPTTYFSNLIKTTFGQQRYSEVLTIVQEIKPDYLSLVTEPGTHESALQLGMTVADWTSYIQSTITTVDTIASGHTTKFGAGSGTWESPSFITSFASITGIDYIDIHAYPLSSNVTNYLELLSTWPALVRNINPALEIISSESWLYKAQASELGGSPTNPEYFARDVYSFWKLLDSQFLDILTINAYKNNYTVIAPFWSHFFFAYLDYNDPSLTGLTPNELLDCGYSNSGQAALNGLTSYLGDHYHSLIVGSGP